MGGDDLAILKVNGVNPFSKYKTLSDAVNKSYGQDIIQISGKHFLEDTLDIKHDLTIKGDGDKTRLSLKEGQLAFVVTQNVNLHFENLTIKVAKECNFIRNLGEGVNLSFDNVKFIYQSKVTARESFPLFVGDHAFNKVELTNVSCKCQFNLNTVHLTFDSVTLGNPFDMSSDIVVHELKIQNSTVHNTNFIGLTGNSFVSIYELRSLGLLSFVSFSGKSQIEGLSFYDFTDEKIANLTEKGFSSLFISPQYQPELWVYAQITNCNDVLIDNLTFTHQVIQISNRNKMPLFIHNSKVKIKNSKLPQLSHLVELNHANIEFLDCKGCLKVYADSESNCLVKSHKMGNDFGAIKQLNEMIGLSNAKEQITKLVAQAVMNHKRQQSGLPTHSGSMHMVFAGSPGTGKAQPLDILIPTPNGYRLFGDLAVGDLVFGIDGKPTVVEGVYPQGDLETWELTLEDGRKKLANKDHLIEYYNFEGERKTDTLEQVYDYWKKTKYLAKNMGTVGCMTSVYLPLCDPVEFNVMGEIDAEFLFNELETTIRNKLKPLNESIELFRKALYLPSKLRKEVLGMLLGHRRLSGITDKRYSQHVEHHKDCYSPDFSYLVVIRDLAYSMGYMSEIETIRTIPNNELYRLKVAGVQIGEQVVSRSVGVCNIKPLNIRVPMQCIKVSNEDGLYLTQDYVVTHNTTVAKLFGQALYEQNVLPTDRFVFANKSDFIGEYLGHTQPKTEALIERARGGVLFIDEAYGLAEDDQFSKEAVETLLQAMENHRDDLVVIAAGYTKDMMHFIEDGNEGLKSRFTHWVDFEDYDFLDLCSILNYQLKAFGARYDQKTFDILCKELKSRLNSKGYLEGNGRGVRNFAEEVCALRDVYLTNHATGVLSGDALLRITPEMLPFV